MVLRHCSVGLRLGAAPLPGSYEAMKRKSISQATDVASGLAM